MDTGVVPTRLTGESSLGFRRVPGRPGAFPGAFQGVDPATGESLDPGYGESGPEEIEQACALAWAAFEAYRETGLEQRAAFLERIAQAITNIGDPLIERAMAETGLPRARLEVEHARTVGQLRLFASVARHGWWLDARIDPAQPKRKPLPRPDLRLRNVPVGPVAVFDASNFPLAFSVACGDTASALAARCPLVVKAHPAHPGTSEFVGAMVLEAAKASGMPEGLFSLLFGAGNALGSALVADPRIKALGFTGSRGGGLALMRIAAGRPEPIPVYAEMSSINPVLILPCASCGPSATRTCRGRCCLRPSGTATRSQCRRRWQGNSSTNAGNPARRRERMTASRRTIITGVGAGLVSAAATRASPAADFQPAMRYPDAAVQIVDPSFEKYRLGLAAVERVATGLRWAEGPVWFGAFRTLLVSDVQNNRIVKWDEETGELGIFRKPSNYANGNTRDRQGRLVTCQHQTRSVTRTEHDGTITTLMDSFEGKPLNSPNDIVCKSDGSIWFTDPAFGPNPLEAMAKPELPGNVYRLDPETKQATVVAGDVRGPNGLCFSPDESKLYIIEARADPRLILVYDVQGTKLANKQTFYDCGKGTADGFRADVDGNLWCGWGMGEDLDGVIVLNPSGKLIGRIRLPERCANLCFGGVNRNRLFMAATKSIYSVYVNTQGAPGG